MSPGRWLTSAPASHYVAFVVLAASGCAVDLWTKHWAFERLGMPDGQTVLWLWEGVFGLATSLNEGALFGIGQGQTMLFAGLSVVAAAGIFYWLFVLGAIRDRLLTTALGCITAGVCGNLYDRLGLPGLQWHRAVPSRGHLPGDPVYAVRDFLHFQIQRWDFVWPTFNVADMLLVTGAAILVLHVFLYPGTPDAKQKPAQ